MPTGPFAQELQQLRGQSGGRTSGRTPSATDETLLRRESGRTLPEDNPPPAGDDSIVKGLLTMLGDLGIGAAKGAGDTANTLGELVNKIPGVGAATTGLGNAIGGWVGQSQYGTKAEPVTADKAHAAVDQDLTATNTSQRVGKGAEQVAEFFVPASPSRLAAIEGLARLIPGGASKSTMAALNKLAAVVGRSAGEAGSAGAVSMLHGDNPDLPMALGAAGPVAGAGMEALVPLLAKSPVLAQIIPWIAGGAAGSALTAATGPLGIPGGLAMTMGVQGAARAATRKLLKDPRTMKAGGQLMRRGTELAARGAAGATGPVRRALRPPIASQDEP